MGFARQAGAAVAPVRRNGPPHSLGKGFHSERDPSAKPVAFHPAYDSLHNCDDCFAHFADSAVGRVLSLALSSNLGVLLLFLGQQLFDRRLWGHCSPARLALCGPSRKRHWHTYVWQVRERPFRYCEPLVEAGAKSSTEARTYPPVPVP
jgi:hypothetical protein